MLEFLTAQPGVVKSPTTTIFGENQAIGSALGTFPRKHGCAQPNPKTIGFDLNMTFHQNNLEGPALEPAESEGIGHGCPLGNDHTLWPWRHRAREGVSECVQVDG